MNHTPPSHSGDEKTGFLIVIVSKGYSRAFERDNHSFDVEALA